MQGRWHRRLTSASVAAFGLVGAHTAADGATLVLHSSMDDADITGSTVHDAVGANDGALLDGVAAGAAGQIGEAIDASTTPGVASVDYSDILNAGAGVQTVSLWFNADTVQTMSLAQKGNSGSADVGWNVFLESRNGGEFLRVAVRAKAEAGSGTSDNRAIAWTDLSAAASTGTWHHVAFVVDAAGGAVTGYVDGVLMGDTNAWGMSFTTDADGVSTTDPLRLGTGLDGRIDDFAIFDGALSADEIATIYQNGLSGLPVPEPASLGLLTAGGVLLAARRRP